MPLHNGIKVYRVLRELSQAELGKKAGISRQTIGLIEKGQLTPSVLLALKLAKALDCHVEDIFSYSESDEVFRKEWSIDSGKK